MTQIEEFRALGLSEDIIEAIKAKGFEAPSPIQRLTIPVLLNQTNDIIAQAQTGTGKTAAFGLPILERLKPALGSVQALILVPTRELALQVTEEIRSFGRGGFSISPIYGGASMTEQLRRLSKGIDIVVGTPGRILDHIRRGTLKLQDLEYLILDEADEMLNMGFIDDVEEILSNTNDYRRILLFSATMPNKIVELSKRYMRDVEILKVESKEATVELTDQIYFEVRESDKLDALTRIIDVEPDFFGIVFCRTKVGVDDLVHKLTERGYAAEGLHGDISQAQREQILRRFKKKLSTILVATDVAARGIDINNLSHVINYSLPQDSESYVHRIGRTGRAGNSGTAITFISSSEYRQFGYLQKDIRTDIRKAPIPTPQDVVEMKKTRIKNELTEIVENENYTEYMDMAAGMLGELPPEVALASLLRLAFKSELEESNYPEIRSINVDRRGTARLFISLGKKDGYNPKKLADLLKRECGLRDSVIDDIKVLDSFSFATVPFSDAGKVIATLNKLKKGGQPVASMASDEKENTEKKERKSKGFAANSAHRPAKPARQTEPAKPSRSVKVETGPRKTGSHKPDPHKAGARKTKKSDEFDNIQWDAFAGESWGGKSGFDKRPAGKTAKAGKKRKQ